MYFTFTVLLSVTFLLGSAQTKEEWFRQKETKRKYLLQQIAALEVYLNYVEKGYRIAQAGLQTIHSIKAGDFQLHNSFFQSLDKTNPSIANWSRIADIVDLHVKILGQVKEGLSYLHNNAAFTIEERQYCAHILESLLKTSFDLIDEFLSFTTSGELSVNDAGRMQKIESVFCDLREQLGFVYSFGEDLKQLALLRQQEKRDSKN
jgi:hypothetical protein